MFVKWQPFEANISIISAHDKTLDRLIYLWGFLLNCTVFSSKLCCLDFHHDQLVDVEEYRLHIHESGEDFNETLRIDEEEQTELFKVPAHRNIEKSDIMFDFKMVSN